MLNPGEYTVGWICALSTEYTAAQECLDEEFDAPEDVHDKDNNQYTLGKIGRHNVVVAVLPDGEYGTASAAVVASHMLFSFPNIRVGLMVGIGGAAPMRHDIRLGDVVVSAPRDGMSGVFQYDFGKTIQGQGFRCTGVLNQPPFALRTAVSAIKAKYKRKVHRIQEAIDAILQKNPRLEQEYRRPDPVTDHLFKPELTHDLLCGGPGGCNQDLSNTIIRRERDEFDDNPMIHYGLIASGNQVVKDAIMRDTLAAQNDVLCFEMEAAGLMNHFPCLVIRGICDYSDTHKNKQWQGYAALAAAVYAKDLLSQIPPKKVEAERRIVDLVSEVLETVSRTDMNVSHVKSKLERQEDTEILNWLTSIDYSPQQEDRINERTVGTGEWLLASNEFQNWLSGTKHTLFCHGIPGAGKTIAASIVVDHLHRMFQDDDSVGIGFAFFNFHQSQVSRSDLLLSLLKQLSHGVVPDAVRSLFAFHTRRVTRPLPDELSHTLKAVFDGFSRTFIVIDALDECDVSSHASSSIITELLEMQKSARVNLFVTSRRKSWIVQRFEEQGCTMLEIRARDQDVRRYIEGQLETFPPWMRETPGLESKITTTVIEATDGMFLLPKYYLDNLRVQTDVAEVNEALENLPRGQDALPKIYEEAMRRIQRQPKKFSSLALQVLSWITQCRRPLSTLELQDALAVKSHSSKLDPECRKDVRLIVEVCAGLVEIDKKSNLIRLAHYTTQEYFAQCWMSWFPGANDHMATVCLTYLNYEHFSNRTIENWGEYIDWLRGNHLYQYAARYWGDHAREGYPEVKELTATFLRCGWALFNSVYALSIPQLPFAPPKVQEGITGLHIAAHYGINEEVMKFLRDTQCHSMADGYGQTPLHWAARNGQVETVELLLREGLDVNATDTTMKSALHYAASQDNNTLIGLLLRHGARVEAVDVDGHTPLLAAAENARVEAARELLSYGARIDALNIMHQNALHLAIMSPTQHSAALVDLLLLHDIDFNLCDIENMTPLHYAVGTGNCQIIDSFVDAGADINQGIERRYWDKTTEYGRPIYNERRRNEAARQKTHDVVGLTPLHFAACIGHNTVTKHLLSKGANPNAQCQYGDTPLHVALRRGLLEPQTKRRGSTLGRYALPYPDAWTDDRWQIELCTEHISDYEGDEAREIYAYIDAERQAVVNTLLKSATIEVNIQNIELDSPLHLVKYDKSSEDATKLLDLGADVFARNKQGQTALHLACRSGASAVASKFLDRGCCIKTTDLHGLNALHYAIHRNQHDTVRTLLESDEALARNLCREVDAQGRTLLHHHLQRLTCSTEMVTILLDHGTRLNDVDNEGNIPLSLYLRGPAWADRTETLHFLLECGADARWTSPDGQNLAHLAMHAITAQVGELAVLWDVGVSFQAKDNSGKNILHHGAIHGSLNEEILNALVGSNFLHLNDRDNEGKTPLHYALEEADKERPRNCFAGDRWEHSLNHLRNFIEVEQTKSRV